MPAGPRPHPHTKTPPERRRTRAPNRSLAALGAPDFDSLPWLVHGFSTRLGGVSSCYGGRTLNLGFTPHDSRDKVDQNRKLFLSEVEALGADGRPWPLVQMKQVHSAIVHRVDSPLHKPLVGDGLITNTPGLLLAVKTADCVPVLVVDTKQHAVGAFHAGWRGTVARIVEKGIGEIRRQFGSNPRDLKAAIGPCIRQCCYSVGEEVRSQFQSQFSYADELFVEVFDPDALHNRYPLLFLNQRPPGHGESSAEIHLDLVEANRRQLLDAGLLSDSISVIEGCTACDTTRFFSHRAEHGKTGRMMAVIGIRPLGT